MGYASTRMRIQSVFEQAGILFLGGDAGGEIGVRLATPKASYAATGCLPLDKSCNVKFSKQTQFMVRPKRPQARWNANAACSRQE
jgi:hypothetical protein